MARYALLIYQIIEPKKECQIVAQALLNKTITGLRTGLNRYELQGDIIHNQKRAWYRYLYAYSNLLQGEELKRQSDLVPAEKYYRTASAFSPDLLDKNVKSAYYYEMVFLIGADKSNGFKEEYLYFLEANPDKMQTLQILTSLTLTDPAYLDELQSYYTRHYTEGESFPHYWEKELQKLPLAPLFNLFQLNKIAFSLENYKGKWILLDFWGTWCEPCIKEMPHLQSFYREITSKHTGKLLLLTLLTNVHV